MRLCLVSPYAWDRPSEANDHWGALAGALARRGHDVVVLAPARKPALARDGRRRLRLLERGDATALAPPAGSPLVVAVGLTVPVATGGAGRSVPIPVSLAAGLRIALEHGRFDTVDALDPDLPGISSLALRESPAPTVASFWRAGPPRRTPRGAERLAGRADAVAAASAAAAETALRRFGLTAEVIGCAVDTARFAPSARSSPPLVVCEAAVADRVALRALFAELEATAAELVFLRSAAAAAVRPLAPAGLAPRLRSADASTPAARAASLRGASAFVAASTGSPLIAREALACGVPIVAVAGSPGAEGLRHERSGLVAPADAPALVGALTGRLLADEPLQARLAEGALALGADSAADRTAERAERLYAVPRPPRRSLQPTPEARIRCDFHLHTAHSHDCATPVERVVERALELGLGAIAVTDHNTIAGGVEARQLVESRGLDLHVVVGSEIKTATGEVIGLYLDREIPRGMPFADTVEAIRAQGALVYVPHPFDRLHSTCDPALLRRLADQIDVVEIYNARLYREAYNHDAERFAERYDLLAGAGSDAHVPEGMGTGCVELPTFGDPESLLLALGAGEIVRRPASLLYLQGLKWMRQARKRSSHAEP